MMQKRINNIDEFCKNPIKIQQKVFDFLISKGKNTAFGKAHHLMPLMITFIFQKIFQSEPMKNFLYLLKEPEKESKMYFGQEK